MEKASPNWLSSIGTLQYFECRSKKYGAMEFDFPVGEVWYSQSRWNPNYLE
jgi:hypothetical protein